MPISALVDDQEPKSQANELRGWPLRARPLVNGFTFPTTKFYLQYLKQGVSNRTTRGAVAMQIFVKTLTGACGPVPL